VILETFRLPIGWKELSVRTAREVLADNCLHLAAQLAFYFFLALFPALLFLVALISFLPIGGLLEGVTGALARVAPGDVIRIVQDQIIMIAQSEGGGILTFGMLGTIWSMSSGMDAIISTLNQAYDIQEARPWWKTKLTAIGLTIALAVFTVVSLALVMVGPIFGERIAASLNLGPAFLWTWRILQLPLVFCLVTLGIAIVYYFAPDAEQDWIWITPGSVLATVLWILSSLGFRFYISNFTSYNATYGAIGGVIVLLLWFYVSSLAIIIGAELNAEIEHASPYGKDPGEKEPGEKKKIGPLAAREWDARRQEGTFRPALARENCDVDRELLPAHAARVVPASAERPMRASDWVLGGVAVGEALLLTYARLKSRFKRPT
jgi:membrane protein